MIERVAVYAMGFWIVSLVAWFVALGVWLYSVAVGDYEVMRAAVYYVVGAGVGVAAWSVVWVVLLAVRRQGER